MPGRRWAPFAWLPHVDGRSVQSMLVVRASACLSGRTLALLSVQIHVPRWGRFAGGHPCPHLLYPVFQK